VAFDRRILLVRRGLTAGKGQLPKGERTRFGCAAAGLSGSRSMAYGMLPCAGATAWRRRAPDSAPLLGIEECATLVATELAFRLVVFGDEQEAGRGGERVGVGGDR
jgi:hypothetical protein